MIHNVWAEDPQASSQATSTTEGVKQPSQDTSNYQPPQQSIGSMLIPMLLMFAIVYFLILRPQQKKQQKHNDFLTNLKRGDSVITSGGILGTVTGITDHIVTLEISDNTRVKLLKSQIAGLDQPENYESKPSKK